MNVNRITLPLALGASVIAGALLGATPIGHAAARMVVPAGSIGAPQLKTNAVTSAKVKNGTLLAKDFKAGQLPAGPQGAKGEQGEPGPAGSIQQAQAGGALTGSYPNPQLANDAVTTDKVTDHSLTLADTASSNGQVSVDLPNIAAHTCVTKAINIAGRHARDLLVIQPTGNLPAGIVVMPIFDVDAGPFYGLRACNITGNALDAPAGGWGYAVYR